MDRLIDDIHLRNPRASRQRIVQLVEELQQEQGLDVANKPLFGAFDWSKSRRGSEFWERVYNGKCPDLLTD